MEHKQHSGLAIAGLVLGIISIVLICVAIGGITGIVGLILSLVAVNQKGKKTGMAIAGIVLNAIAVAIFILMFFVFNDEETNSNTISSIEYEQQEQIIENKKITATVGEYIQNDTWKVSLLEAKEYNSIKGEYFIDSPESEGNKYLVLFFEIENVSGKDEHFNIFYMESYLDGYVIEDEYLVNNPENYSSLGGDVAPGKKAKGYIAYEVSPDWQELEFSYKEYGDSDKNSIIFVVNKNDLK